MGEDASLWALFASSFLAATLLPGGSEVVLFGVLKLHPEQFWPALGVATLGNAGSESRKEFTAIGDSVNVANRLLENAQPGQIIISEDTYQQSWQMLANPQSGIKLIPREEPIQVKGRKQTVRVYQVARRSH